jgi:predicted GTPase
MSHGAAYAAALGAGAARLVDPRPYASGALAATYSDHPHIGPVLPAMGYSRDQIEELRRTIDSVPADVVVAGTPIDLAALLPLNKPVVRARYEYAERGARGLWDHVEDFLRQRGVRGQ